MPPDVVDLRSFYTSPLGRVAQRFIERTIRELWPHCNGQSVLGIGYATPYIASYREGAVRVVALMPAEQGVVAWPDGGVSSAALAEVDMLPLPDACIDRVVLAHVIEYVDLPRDLLAEVWRILTPGGRVIIVAPNRRGLWSRVDTTPFGHGRPYSKSQLRELLRETLFSPENWAELLYVPPFERPSLLRLASAFEGIGGRFDDDGNLIPIRRDGRRKVLDSQGQSLRGQLHIALHTLPFHPHERHDAIPTRNCDGLAFL